MQLSAREEDDVANYVKTLVDPYHSAREIRNHEAQKICEDIWKWVRNCARVLEMFATAAAPTLCCQHTRVLRGPAGA